jgi:hypothetical protein
MLFSRNSMMTADPGTTCLTVDVRWAHLGCRVRDLFDGRGARTTFFCSCGRNWCGTGELGLNAGDAIARSLSTHARPIWRKITAVRRIRICATGSDTVRGALPLSPNRNAGPACSSVMGRLWSIPSVYKPRAKRSMNSQKGEGGDGQALLL